MPLAFRGKDLIRVDDGYELIDDSNNHKRFGEFLVEMSDLDIDVSKIIDAFHEVPNGEAEVTDYEMLIAVNWLKEELGKIITDFFGHLVACKIVYYYNMYLRDKDSFGKGMKELILLKPLGDNPDLMLRQEDEYIFEIKDIRQFFVSIIYAMLIEILGGFVASSEVLSQISGGKSDFKDELFEYSENDMMKYGIVFSNNEFHEVYSFDSLTSFFLFDTYNSIKSKVLVKRCENCKKFFIPQKRSDTIYCDRNSPQDSSKTCKKYGAEKQYQQNLKEDVAKSLYRKIYMSKQMLVRRNPEIKVYENAFENFKKQAKEWKDDIKKELRTTADYIKWLEDVRDKRIK